MSQEHDSLIRDFFKHAGDKLPTNFSYLVMQRVYRQAIRQAQQQAALQSWLVGIAVFLSGTLVLFGYSVYAGGLTLTIPGEALEIVLPVVVALICIVGLDFGLKQHSQK